MIDRDNYIRINLLNLSFGRVLCSKARIKPFTTFRLPQARFSKMYKEKKWDGTISIIKWNKLPLGLIPYFVMEATKRDLVVEFYFEDKKLEPHEVEDIIFKGMSLSLDDFSDMLAHLPEHISPRYYQMESISSMMSTTRGQVLVPTGGGKSLILYLISYLLYKNMSTGLLLAPRTDLVYQLSERFHEFSKGTMNVLTSTEYGETLLDLVTPDEPCLIISTWQSWSTWIRNNLDLPEINYLLADEVHTLAAKKLAWPYMEAFSSVRYRYGVTATENALIHERLTVEGLFGPVLYKESPQELIKKRFLAKPHIHRIFIHHHLDRVGDGKTRVYKEDLLRRPERMLWIAAFIESMLQNKKESIIILTEAVEEELKPLVEILESVLDGFDILSLTRQSKRAERKRTIDQVGAPERPTVLVVTYGLFQMGIDIPTLGRVLFFAPSGSHIRVLQSIGRVLRPKETCHVYDLIDYSDEYHDRLARKRASIYKGAYGDEMDITDEYIEI